jgi:hypothetical protein
MTQHAEWLPRYRRLRQVGLERNNRLVKTLARSARDEGGQKLGILKRNALVLDTEDEIAVLMEYCLHDVRRHGLDAIERFLNESPPATDTDEWVLLNALRGAQYSLFVVESAESGVGIHVRDLLRDETRFLIDIGLGSTAAVGMVLAARVMTPDGMGMTTGAALPIGIMDPAERSRLMGRLRVRFPGMDFGNLSPEEASELTAAIIRTCLRRGAAERITYVEPGALARPTRARLTRLPAPHIGRNDPCPCGSGKIFKHCCGTRR